MAWDFSLWIVTEDETDGNTVRDFFNSISTLETTDGTYRIFASQSFKGDGIKDSVTVTVDGISRSGVTSENDAQEMTKIGFEFYKLLKSAPKFRYALVGVEVEEVRYWDELVKDPSDILLFKGLVIRKDLHEFLGGPGLLEEFKDNYLWTPYEGETYGQK